MRYSLICQKSGGKRVNSPLLNRVPLEEVLTCYKSRARRVGIVFASSFPTLCSAIVLRTKLYKVFI